MELKNPIVLFCLVNVYFPVQGLAEMSPCLLNVWMNCMRPSSSISQLIRSLFVEISMPLFTEEVMRDALFREFVEDHELNSNYPVQETFFHASSDSSTQNDYFLVGPSRVPLQSVVTISDKNHLNFSDHAHLEICISGIGA